MARPMIEPLQEEGLGPSEMDEANAAHAARDYVAISRLQGRAGNHLAAAVPRRLVDDGTDAAQPRFTLLVAERDILAHPLDVFGRVKIVGVVKAPAESVGQRTTHCRLAAASHADHDHD